MATKKKGETERGTRSLQRSEEKICREHGLSNEEKKVVAVTLEIIGLGCEEETDTEAEAQEKEKKHAEESLS